MSLTLAEVFDEHFKKVKFDNRLARLVYGYQLWYVNHNREHLEFFGSNLIGVQVVRFKDKDVLKLFDEVLDIDFIHLSNDIKKVPSINQDFKISSDVFNLTIMYLIHRFMTSALINDNQRKKATYDSAILFFYRTISALLSDYFRYPADPKVVQMAYANLSNKFLIKKLGSWHKVMDYRAKDLSGKEGIHYDKLVSFNNDLAIVYAINDSQGRIRDMVKSYYSEFMKVNGDGEKIASTSSTFMDAEGEEAVKEKTRSIESYVDYIKGIVSDKHSFVRDDLVGVISRMNTNSSFRMIKSVLNWMSDNSSNSKYNKTIEEFVGLSVVHSFFLLSSNVGVINMRDYPHILVTLKNLYLSTRSTDKDLTRIRELGEDIIRASQTDKVGDSLMLATRTSIILYIALRTLVGINR